MSKWINSDHQQNEIECKLVYVFQKPICHALSNPNLLP